MDINKLIEQGYKLQTTELSISPEEQDMLNYLTKIIQDRSIPEENKVEVKKQLDELIRVINITQTPRIILTKE